MVTRVHKHVRDRFAPRGPVVKIEGRIPLNVQVSITGQELYGDWISIEDTESSIFLKGNHVHELITTILRFFTKKMRDNYRALLDMTDIVTNNTPYQKSFDDYQVRCEERTRKHEEKFSEKREKDIHECRMALWKLDREGELNE